MAERSFAREVQTLRLGAGGLFEGEAILAVTKALLQAGVSYVGGYQGAPVSHLMDVLADAREILDELGVRFESSASEAGAAAMLAASINYPLRGAVTWKSTVGTNVASDALSNLASAGVQGGALMIVGEDYGEGASIMQERTHAFAMKSQIWLLDPRPDTSAIVDMVERGFELSEASQTPVMLMLRIRACHMHGSFVAKDNVAPRFRIQDALENPQRSAARIILPPGTYAQEQEKVLTRWPAAVRFIVENHLNEMHAGDLEGIGIVMQGGLYNTVLRSLEMMGLADVFGESRIPLYVLNVTYPLVPNEFVEFASGKQALLIVEEGQPEYIEQSVNQFLRNADIQTRVVGKGPLPMAGEYTGAVVSAGIKAFLAQWAPEALAAGNSASSASAPANERPLLPIGELRKAVPPRPPGLCTGCPERPFFSSMKIVQKELGSVHVSADIGCHSFATLAPFHMGASIMGYGLGPASGSALSGGQGGKRSISVMGDGGFWHNGLTSGIGNSVFNQHDSVTVIVDNGYAAATGGQYIPSSRAEAKNRKANNPIERAVRGVGVEWVRTVQTYKMQQGIDALREALTTAYKGPKVIIAEGECQLNRARRVAPVLRQMVKEGKRVVRQRFGIDPDVCTGDHSCIRLSGCPSLTIKSNPDPLRRDPVAHVDNSCVGCGVCGEVAHAAVLCPSFYRADVITNPGAWDRFKFRFRSAVIEFLQRRFDRRLARIAAEPLP
ncbi:MAG TPA: indolepyruvate ferredoxin oxidoreductase subunit alpha [Steroidobacteraceae bacterium]|jgi:indolepyruvate ferredoxin oxidoreductase alpha subunit